MSAVLLIRFEVNTFCTSFLWELAIRARGCLCQTHGPCCTSSAARNEQMQRLWRMLSSCCHTVLHVWGNFILLTFCWEESTNAAVCITFLGASGAFGELKENKITHTIMCWRLCVQVWCFLLQSYPSKMQHFELCIVSPGVCLHSKPVLKSLISR